MNDVIKEKLVRYLESIGKSKFINYFESFKNDTFVKDCKEAIKSKELRQNFAKYIFVNNLELEALHLCVLSKISPNDKVIADRLIKDYTKSVQLSSELTTLLSYESKHQATNEYLLKLLNAVSNELKVRKMIRGKNIVGDLAEYYVMSYFNKSPKLPKLEMETQSNKGYDLYDINNHKRYQVKGITQIQTSDFHVGNKNDIGFDYIVIVKMDDKFYVNEIYMLDAIYLDEVKKNRKNSDKSYIVLNSKFKKLAQKLI